MSFPFVQPYFGLGNSLQTAQASGGGAVGGWVELGRTTLGSAGDTISVASLPDKRYYMVIADILATGTSPSTKYRFNNDTGSNYASRWIENDSGEQTETSQSYGTTTTDSAKSNIGVAYISNLAGQEKLAVSRGTDYGGGIPNRFDSVFKWVNTSNAINRIDLYNPSSGSFNTGSSCVVLGWDPTDTHTTNFWEELDSSNGDGSGGWSSGTFAAKTYLWVQAWVEPSTSARLDMTFNSDSGGNYTRRQSENGGSASTGSSQSAMLDVIPASTVAGYVNFFIINRSSTAKLCVSHAMNGGASGAGSAPVRIESAFKWENTSAQITSIDMIPSAGNYSSTSIMKVWGSD
jgi:hypothetical protein